MTRLRFGITQILACGWLAAAASAPAMAQQSGVAAVQKSPLTQLPDGRQASNNNQIMTSAIRDVKPDFKYPPSLPSNHALIITVSEYARSPLPGVLNDRKLGIVEPLGERPGAHHTAHVVIRNRGFLNGQT